MCRLVSYRHVIANAPAGTFFSPPLGCFFSCLLYLILVCVCRLMAMLRVNRLSRANLYLLYSYTQILILFSPIVPQKKNNETKQASACFVREKKKHHDGTRKANCIRVSFFCPFPRLFLLSYASGLWRLHSSH